MTNNDQKLEAVVLRRTNYGETDRIVNFLTPKGKKAALVRGARKERSKLAGGIEIFALTDIGLHESTKSPDSIAILTSAKTRKFYQNIITNLDSLELGSEILKRASKAADAFDSPDLFNLVVECFEALNSSTLSLICIEVYFRLTLASICGEEVNLITDINGEKLSLENQYFWDGFSKTLSPNVKGNISSDHIKLMRLMLASNLLVISRVQDLDELLPDLLEIAKSF